MYIFTAFAAFVYAALGAMKYSKVQYEETGVKPSSYDTTVEFIQKFFVALFILWALETYLYWKILTMDPTP